MDIHVCKQCGSQFSYCRKCVFKPIRYKDAGFCSKECYEASKIKVVPIVEEVSIKDVEPVKEEVLVEAEVIVSEDTSDIETAIVVEPTIKNETNTYKKKKNKYKVHE